MIARTSITSMSQKLPTRTTKPSTREPVSTCLSGLAWKIIFATNKSYQNYSLLVVPLRRPNHADTESIGGGRQNPLEKDGNHGYILVNLAKTSIASEDPCQISTRV